MTAHKIELVFVATDDIVIQSFAKIGIFGPSIPIITETVDTVDSTDPNLPEECVITKLVDDGNSGYSPIIPVYLPVEASILIVKLPLYEPDMPCSELTNADIEYSFVEDPPEWLILDQDNREV